MNSRSRNCWRRAERRTTTLALIALLLVAVAGCGGSSHGFQDSGQPPAADAASDQRRLSDGPGADQAPFLSSDGAPDLADDTGAGASDAPADQLAQPDGGSSASDAPPDAASGDGGADSADAASSIDGSDGQPSSDAGAGSDGPICPPEMQRAGWSILAGGFTAVGMNVDRPSLVVTTTDRPTLAWDENARLQAVEWVPGDCAFELMGIPRVGNDPALAAAANDKVVLASVQNSAGPVIAIETFDGSNWIRLYDFLRPTVTQANMSSTRIQLDGAGLPVVGWIENQFSAPKLQVARWNGTAWVRLTDATGVLGVTVRDSQTMNGLASLPFDLALGSDGQPIVSWRTTTSGPTVARYNGTQWAQVGATLPDTLAFSSADVNAPVLQVDSTGAIYAVWSHLNGALYSANVARFSGTVWTQLGGALLTAPGSLTEYGMALDGTGAPVVASAEVTSPSTGTMQQIFTYRWNGTSWLSPAQPLDDRDPASFVVWPSITIDHAGRWLVTWVSAPYLVAVRSVYLARFTPTN